jgi:HD-GYP domain-containing protein (c-di-GMP phosphodiesterase class II)
LIGSAPSRAGAFAAGTIGLGIGVIVLATVDATRNSLGMLALLAAAIVVTELFQVGDDGSGIDGEESHFCSFSSSVQMAAVVVLGPLGAALVAPIGVLVIDPLRGAQPRKVAFNAGVFTLATLAGGLVFVAAGGTVGETNLPHDIPALIALAVAYFAVNTLLVNSVIALHSGRSLRAELPNFSLGTVSLHAAETGLAATLSFFVLSNAWKIVFVVPLVLAVYQAQARLAALRGETARALETFANVVDERDPYTFRHSARVAGYVEQLGEALRLPASEVARLRWAGRLHDLGKISVDRSVLFKEGSLDEEEWAAMSRHPRLSARLLRRFRFAVEEARAVEYHHERFDGRGYYGIPASEQPLAAHFLIVADSFDAMTTDRPYRKGLSPEAALGEIERHAGAQFHPAVAKAFVALQRGIDPLSVLGPGEQAELRRLARRRRGGPTVAFSISPGEASVVVGVVAALVAAGFGQPEAAVAALALSAVGIGATLAERRRVRLLVSNLRVILAAPLGVDVVFAALVRRLAELTELRWAGLVGWHEEELAGWIDREQRLTSEKPDETSLTSWLIRDAEAGERILRAAGSEVGGEGTYLAVPLQPGGATAGFVVLALGSNVPRRLLRALEICAPELEDAFAAPRPPAREQPEPELARRIAASA